MRFPLPVHGMPIALSVVMVLSILLLLLSQSSPALAGTVEHRVFTRSDAAGKDLWSAVRWQLLSTGSMEIRRIANKPLFSQNLSSANSEVIKHDWIASDIQRYKPSVLSVDFKNGGSMEFNLSKYDNLRKDISLLSKEAGEIQHVRGLHYLGQKSMLKALDIVSIASFAIALERFVVGSARVIGGNGNEPFCKPGELCEKPSVLKRVFTLAPMAAYKAQESAR